MKPAGFSQSLLHLIVFSVCISCQSQTQESAIFNAYKAASKKGITSQLPNFSYAGYHRGLDLETSIPEHRYNPVDYGAIPDDSISDIEAIANAINDAIKSGGTIAFPAGRFLINEDEGRNTSEIFSLGEHPVQIEGHPDGTELFMRHKLISKTPEDKWTTPYMLRFNGSNAEELVGPIIEDAEEGQYGITLRNPEKLAIGDWIVLSIADNDSMLIQQEMRGLPIDEKWTNLTEGGVQIRMIHQVKEVMDSSVLLEEPLLKSIDSSYKWEVYKIKRHEQLVIKNIQFRGNWKEPFVHHKSIHHDGAFSILDLRRLANFQLINCTFTDVNRAVTIKDSAFGSVLGNEIKGNFGHSAISLASCTRILVGLNKDEAGQWHTFGVAKPSIGNVLWRNEHAPHASMESHASQPRITLVDCAKGGMIAGRFGGAIKNLPNHMEKLVLWNYENTGDASDKFEFWRSVSPYGKVIPPIIIGFHGNTNTTFPKDQVEYIESMGKAVQPESLYEAQLEFRLGALPAWLIELKK